jgi:ABC-type uncharacterized transport system permease subunit
MQMQMNVPTSIVNVVQSLIIFFMLILPGIRKKLQAKRERSIAASASAPKTTAAG